MRFDPEYRPFVAPKCIYIVPLSLDPSHYQVLIPANLSKHLLDLLIQDKLVIRKFHRCPQEAAATVTAQLQRSCTQGPSRYSNRMNQLIVLGTVLFVLGIINWTFPDPLPLIDEILMIGGGAGVGIAGYVSRRKNLSLLQNKTGKAAQRLSELECADDPLLTRIHEAIRAKSSPDYDRSGKEAVDLFEVESEWLVKYLDLQRLLDSNAATIKDLGCLLDVLSNAFPLPRFLALEQKLRRDPTDRRTRRARDSLAQRYGLSGDAFTVYAEFYRLGRQMVSEQADRL
jgi:hypothetical protein